MHLLAKANQTFYHPKAPLEIAEAFVVEQWKCAICAELNEAQLMKCSICGVPKPKPSLSKPASPAGDGWTCHVCTFVNTTNAMDCEMCGTRKKIVSPVPTTEKETADYIKLSFRDGGGGQSNFVAHLQIALQRKDWKSYEQTDRVFDPLVVGVAGLMKTVDASQKVAASNLNLAFDDLDALMSKAGEMAKLAETISSKLINKTETVDDAQESEFKMILQEMGITSAVTRDMAGSTFVTELARQLSESVLRLLEVRKSVLVTLADVYCVYNRARGSNLISPKELYDAAQQTERMQLPVMLVKLPSGVLAFQRRSVGEDPVIKAITAALTDETASLDALELSRLQNVTLSIALMYLRQAEQNGSICRDQLPSGTIRYYRNIFP